MKSRVNLQIGDQVTLANGPLQNKVGGVIVFKNTNPKTMGVKEGKIYNVHWYKPPRSMKDRGQYTSEEIVKIKNLSSLNCEGEENE